MADSYNDLIPQMLLDLPGCESRTALQQLQLVGRNFCKETKVWTEDLRPYAAFAQQASYEISHNFDAYIFRLASVKFKNVDYTPYNQRRYKLSENTNLVFEQGYIPSDDSADAYNAALVYSEGDVVQYNNLIYVASEDIAVPEAFDEDHWQGDTSGLGIEVSVILVPFYEAIEFPEWFIERYAEALTAGAIAKLAASAGKPYTDPETSAINRQTYRGERTRAKNDHRMNYTDYSNTVRG